MNSDFLKEYMSETDSTSDTSSRKVTPTPDLVRQFKQNYIKKRPKEKQKCTYIDKHIHKHIEKIVVALGREQVTISALIGNILEDFCESNKDVINQIISTKK